MASFVHLKIPRNRIQTPAYAVMSVFAVAGVEEGRGNGGLSSVAFAHPDISFSVKSAFPLTLISPISYLFFLSFFFPPNAAAASVFLVRPSQQMCRTLISFVSKLKPGGTHYRRTHRRAEWHSVAEETHQANK